MSSPTSDCGLSWEFLVLVVFFVTRFLGSWNLTRHAYWTNVFLTIGSPQIKCRHCPLTLSAAYSERSSKCLQEETKDRLICALLLFCFVFGVARVRHLPKNTSGDFYRQLADDIHDDDGLVMLALLLQGRTRSEWRPMIDAARYGPALGFPNRRLPTFHFFFLQD